MIQKTFIFIFAIFSTLFLSAQTVDDALRFSQTFVSGTARGAGAAGAFGAVGADFTSLSSNPAGIGFYRKSELVLTPSIFFSETESNYLGTQSTDNRNNFHFNNAGVVFANLKKNRKGEQKDWRSVNFALGFNRLNNYNNRNIISGFNEDHSLTTYYAEQAQGIAEDDIWQNRPFDAGPAYFAFLINPEFPGSNQYVGVAETGGVQQEQFTTTKRALDEASMAIGANYKDKLYLGLNLGIPIARFDSEVIYTEEDTEDNIDNFESFQATEFLNSDGIGLNGKFGLIYRINDNVRVGGAVHTPTLFTFTEEFSTTVSSEFSTGESYNEESPTGEFEYRLKTPWKFVASAAGFIAKKGFVSVDYEWSDPSQAEFSLDSSNPDDRSFFSDLNLSTRQAFQPTHTLRLGGEAAFNVLRARLGYAYTSTPYATGNKGARQSLSAGLGVRESNIFIDLAYVYSFWDSSYTPYTLSDQAVETADLDFKASNVVISLGFRF